MKGPAGAIGVERHGDAVGLEDGPQGAEDGVRGLGGPELGVEQALGGVVDDGDEGVELGRAERQPGVLAAVELEQLAETGAGLAAPAMAAARAALAHEAGFLEGELDEAVGEQYVVIAAGEVVEVPHIEAEIRLTIELQDALDFERWGLAA